MLIVYADGACRGNPGPMGIGVSIQKRDGEELEIVFEAIGEGTNNVAEYRAAIEGLKRARKHSANEIELRMDSELVVRQLNGEYQVKKAELKPLWRELRALLDAFQSATVTHIRREQNQRADELANLALDARESVLDEAERGLVQSIVSLFKEKKISRPRGRLIMAEVGRLLKLNGP